MRTEVEVAPIGYRATPLVDSTVMPAPISLHAVNGWRGVGALAIVFAHFWIVTGMIRFGDLRPIALLVDLFFVLSGLLISQAYMDKLSHASAIPEYIVRRFGRIWPVHAAMLALLVAYETFKLVLQVRFGKQFTSPAFAAHGLDHLSAIWTNLLLVHSLGIHRSETWNFPSWSLSVEFATYAIFSLFCLWRPITRRAASVAAVVFSVGILVFVAPTHMRSTYDYGLFRCVAGFFAGSLLNDLLRSTRLPLWPLPTVVEALALALLIVWLCLCFDTSLAYAAPVVFCLFILAFIQGRGVISRLLLTKPFQFLAELSFTIYMVHAVILVMLLALLHAYERASGVPFFIGVLNPYPLPGNPAAMMQVVAPQSAPVLAAIAAGYFGSVMLAAYGAYRFIEIPGRIFFGSLAKRVFTLRGRKGPEALAEQVSSGLGPT